MSNPAKISPLAKVLADEAIGILIRPALKRPARLRKVERNYQLLFKAAAAALRRSGTKAQRAQLRSGGIRCHCRR